MSTGSATEQPAVSSIEDLIEPHKMYTEPQVAELFNIKRGTLRNWRSERKRNRIVGPEPWQPGATGTVRYRGDKLLEWLDDTRKKQAELAERSEAQDRLDVNRSKRGRR